jgi:hypothetical protein
MNTVIVRVKGGLGNQLFCYAAARRLAIVNDADLAIDDVTGFTRDLRYQRKYALGRFHIPARRATPHERMEPFARYRRSLAKLIAKHRPFHRRQYIEQEGEDFDPRLLDLKIRRTVYLDGYWQSEDYFKDVEDVIRRDLQIPPPEDAMNRQMAERIRVCSAVAIHVRWFDRPGSEGAMHNVSVGYYRRALTQIKRRISDPHLFVFSDDPGSARILVGLPGDCSTYVNHNRAEENAYADLWLMSQCKHFIIANSTFSWWGAWLAGYENKMVLTPDIRVSGITSWGFRGLVPETWIRI